MLPIAIELGAPDTDKGADQEISNCLDLREPKSFFLYAGAGSGKTRSLKDALYLFRDRYGDEFRRNGKKVAVITYTNTAADEIAERVGKDSLFPISTIHSFCWTLIGGHHSDIQAWLLATLPNTLVELHEKHAKGRVSGKAAQDRERAIAATIKRLDWLSTPRRFIYNPNGNNFGSDSLSHSEVLKITSSFIQSKPSIQAVLVNKYPFLLIDESQDTSKALIDAFFGLAAAHKGKFALGLFGDMMQRIFPDGRPDLDQHIPLDWAQPVKCMNHRSPQRVVQLGNSLRAEVDGWQQQARNDSAVGTVRFFIAPANTGDKAEAERKARARMAELCADKEWLDDSAVKTLTLEHHMAAGRRGFLPMFQALDQDSRLATGVRNGELAGLRIFTESVAPLLAASAVGDRFAVMAHLRKTSPLLKRTILAACSEPGDPLLPVRAAVDALVALDVENSSTRFLDVLACVAKHGLFEIPSALTPFGNIEDASPSLSGAIKDSDLEGGEENIDDEAETSPSSLRAWRAFLETPFKQAFPYSEYVSDRGPYGTHQGVKGREFDRVLVVLDDSEARGRFFSYEKLLGAKPLSDQDWKNEMEGLETGIDRTRRLLYVTCTRAQRSLALVAYSESPEELSAAVVRQGWFTRDELERL